VALRRKPKQARGEKRIERILEAAAQLFDEIGVDAATTIQIAQRAETAIGSLYGFFPNKEAIADAVGRRITDDLRELTDSLVSPELITLPIEQALDRLITPLIAFISTRAGFRALFLYAPQFGQLSPAQKHFEELLTSRMTGLLMLRYGNAQPDELRRVVSVCFEIVKRLTGLAVASDPVDQAVVTELKAVLVAYLRARLGH
jgi:AcrR family transcriptional regulator